MASAREVLASWMFEKYEQQYAGSSVEAFAGDADALTERLASAGYLIAPIALVQKTIEGDLTIFNAIRGLHEQVNGIVERLREAAE